MKYAKLTAISLFMTLTILSAALAAPKEITKIEVDAQSGLEKIEIKVSDYVKIESAFFKDNLVIDFPDTIIKKTLKKNTTGSRYIHKINAWQFKSSPYVARVVIEFKKQIAYDVYSLMGQNVVMVELGDDLALPFHIQHSYPIKRKNIPGALPWLEAKTIVVDPGHGGIDPGGIGYTGTFEKNLTLPVALKLKDFLVASGAKVIMTRKSDQTTDYRKISAKTNKIKSDMFISIHFNYYEDSSAAGTETFYYNPFSIELAHYVHRSLISTLQRRDRGVRKDRLYTVHHTDMPAILVELLYITNPTEEQLAISTSYQEKIARALYNGISRYFKKISR